MQSRYLFTIYQDKGKLFRWRLSHRNGKIIADGGEGYATRGNCLRAVRRLATIALLAKVAS